MANIRKKFKGILKSIAEDDVLWILIDPLPPDAGLTSTQRKKYVAKVSAAWRFQNRTSVPNLTLSDYIHLYPRL